MGCVEHCLLLLTALALACGSPLKSNRTPKTRQPGDPDPCCVPTSQGNASVLVSANIGGHALTFKSSAIIAVDNPNYKATIHNLAYDPNQPQNFVNVYIDWSQGLVYVAMPQSKTCSTENVPAGGQGTCIPYDAAVYGGRANLGWDKDANTQVDMWTIDGRQAGLDLMLSAWTLPSKNQLCGLAKLAIWGSTPEGYSIVANIDMYNMTLGVKDKSIFNVPSYCNSDESIKENVKVVDMSFEQDTKLRYFAMSENFNEQK